MASGNHLTTLGAERQAARLVVHGIVQGVGFRPFVYSLAIRYTLTGSVRNTSSGVEIILEGAPEDMACFIHQLQHQLPPLAKIESIETQPIAVTNLRTFTILASTMQAGAYQAIPPDVATCPQCLGEVDDPSNRRYRYPFTNCTNCGPRFTIIDDVPYDRPSTTMRGFAMCPDCQAEYDNPADRRFHAQPNACPVCGPYQSLVNPAGNEIASHDQALVLASEMIKAGKIVALKGLGGFQLACDATNQAAVLTLRRRKNRPAKPFAIMMRDITAIKRYAAVNEHEARLLQSPAAPIVLCKRTQPGDIADAVAPRLDTLGVMLPYTPLHHLLIHDTDLPLVMTSGNLSEEPLACSNQEAFDKLASIADAFLVHNRDINTRLDDSVFYIVMGQAQPVRRARGYAPVPLELPENGPAILACGADLKNTFCLTRENHAFLSQHLGDMQNLETWGSFESSLALFEHVFHTEPTVIAYDMHPDYITSKFARSQTNLNQIAVQHHHAHLASCLVDTGYPEPVIGVVWDGTGYGLDGTIWGGEFLVGDARGFTRAGRLQPMPLPGGEAAIHKPYRLAMAYWFSLFNNRPLPARLAQVPAGEQATLLTMLSRNFNTPCTTSAGRLFDAVSALLGICPTASYEAQAAIELEAAAAKDTTGITFPYQLLPFTDLQRWGRVGVSLDEGLEISLAGIIESIGSDNALPLGAIAYRFHLTLARIIADCCQQLSARTGLGTVALTGGCFQNRLLLNLTCNKLADAGLNVLVHRRVPCNDGGVALGQAVIAQYALSGGTECA